MKRNAKALISGRNKGSLVSGESDQAGQEAFRKKSCPYFSQDRAFLIVTSMNHGVIGELIKDFVFGQDDRNYQCGSVTLPFELVTTYFLFERLLGFVSYNFQ